MRQLAHATAVFFLLTLSAAASAQYASPPIDLLIHNNSALAPSLDSYYNSSYAQNGTVTARFGTYRQNIPVSASIIPVGLSPTIDNVSCYSPDLAFFVARGYHAGMLTSLPSEGYPDFNCDRGWYDSPGKQYEWRCDFDGDTCIEYVNRTFVLYEANATFSFRNITESVPLESSQIPVPPAILSALHHASGAENLSISINGSIVFIYEINNRTEDGDCHDNSTNVSASVPISTNATYTVGGDDKLVILVRPILREQWFRDNRFDTLILAQCPLYRAEIRLNNASAKNITLRSYNLTTDEFGFKKMVSNLSDGEGYGWAEHSSSVATPTQLEQDNNSFAYLYEFNFSYAGLGKNSLSISATDSVLDAVSYNDTLLSRMLSHGGATNELGGAMMNNTRPSARFIEGSLTHLEIGLGLVGVVLILAFLNFWIPR